MDTLNPMIEAAHLLQARKTDEDVDSICEMCSNLSAQQICKILTLYTPADDYEPRVTTSFIRKVQAKLAERQEAQEQKVVINYNSEYKIVSSEHYKLLRKVSNNIVCLRCFLIFQPLLMDIKYNFPVRFPFNPSTICLEDIEIPEVLNLPMLKKV